MASKKSFGELKDQEQGKEGEEENLKNYIFITKYEEWQREQKACRQERKVIALEITNLEGCERMRPLFLNLAKEYDDVPFIRVLTGPSEPFIATNTICRDVGVVKELPTILLLYYDSPDHIKRKSYQGESAIQNALENGELKRKFKEFIGERLQQMLEGSLRVSEKDNVLRPSKKGNEGEENGDDTDCRTSSTKRSSMSSRGASRTNDDDFVSESSLKTSISSLETSSVSTSHIIKRDDIIIGERIGQGGYGTVFQAMWKKKKVAVKVCSGNFLEQGGAEVDILASLPSHPNVITFFGVAVSEDEISSLIVTELAVGGSLYSCLHGKKREIPTTDQSLGWAFQIASGMEYLHSHNVIHRDLKSANILLSRGKQAMICDFGTARQLSETCLYTEQAGTYRWMAPEVAQECYAKISNKCDVFSYGMVLYEIYTLELPFGDIPSDVMVCCAIMDGKRPPVPQKLPPFLHLLLQECWNKEPTQRPSFKMIIMTIQTESYEKEKEQ